MPTIAIGGRRHGKTFAAAQAAGMSMDAYRELMLQQRERLEAARALLPPATPDRLSAAWWDQIARIGRPHVGQSRFMQEYLCEFESEPIELVGPPSPTFEAWQRNQERIAAQAERDNISEFSVRGQDFFRYYFFGKL